MLNAHSTQRTQSYQPGEMIGKYELLEKLGSGSFGTVWKVNNSLGETLAMKHVSFQSFPAHRRERLETNLQREIQIMKMVNHPHLIKILDSFQENSDWFLVMPFYDSDLQKYRTKCGGVVSEDRAYCLMKQIGMGFMELAKHKIIHRDFKLENVLMDLATNTLVIADFGLSSHGKLSAATNVGTPVYQAPEITMCRNGWDFESSTYDSKVDIYSLGLAFFELTTGCFPASFNELKQQPIKDLTRFLMQRVGRNLKFPRDARVSEDTKNLIRLMTEPDPLHRIEWVDLLQRLENWNKPVPKQPTLSTNSLQTPVVSVDTLLDGFRTTDSICFDHTKVKINRQFGEKLEEFIQTEKELLRFEETVLTFAHMWKQTSDNYIDFVTFLYDIPQTGKILVEKFARKNHPFGSGFTECLRDLSLLVIVYLFRLVGSIQACCTGNPGVGEFKQEKHEYFKASPHCEVFMKQLNGLRTKLTEKFQNYLLAFEEIDGKWDFETVPDFEVKTYEPKSVKSMDQYSDNAVLVEAIKSCECYLIDFSVMNRDPKIDKAAAELQSIHSRTYLLLNYQIELQLTATQQEQYNVSKELVQGFESALQYFYYIKAKNQYCVHNISIID